MHEAGNHDWTLQQLDVLFSTTGKGYLGPQNIIEFTGDLGCNPLPSTPNVIETSASGMLRLGDWQACRPSPNLYDVLELTS